MHALTTACKESSRWSSWVFCLALEALGFLGGMMTSFASDVRNLAAKYARSLGFGLIRWAIKVHAARHGTFRCHRCIWLVLGSVTLPRAGRF